MKRKIIIGIFFSVLFIICLSLYFKRNTVDNNIVLNDNSDQEINSMISIMVETGHNTGVYEESTTNNWPEPGYIFNENLSGCENGGKLSWDSVTNKVKLSSPTSDACYVYFDLYIFPTINEVIISNVSNDSITLTVNASNGENVITNYFFSSGAGIINNGNNNVYTFNNLEKGTEYSFEVYVKDSLGYTSEIYKLNGTTDDTLLLADWVINEYNGVQGNNGIYYHTSSLANSAGDNSYRYAGANPNNYVCFGSDASTCPSDNLYRIIGVFGNEVKLIKSTSIGNYEWNSSGNNTWDAKTKPYIYTLLNSNYLNGLANHWNDMISNTSYNVGGMGSSRSYTAKNYYDLEIGSSQTGYTESMKIGLMYVSDFGFAASNDYWSTALYVYEPSKDSNWLAGYTEWTISRTSTFSLTAFYINSTGAVNGNDSNRRVTNTYAVRPVFYLNSNVAYASGTGTSSDPVQIFIN